MTYILIQKNDEKAQSLRSIAKEYGINIVPIKGSPILIPIYILNYTLKNKKPKGIVYRYLNDYNSFFKSFIRMLTDILGIFLSIFFRVNVLWICHNIDRESTENYPKLIKIRRYFLRKFCSKIYVTDEILVPYAQRKFNKELHKIDYLTFGTFPKKEISEDATETINIIKEFIDYHQKQNINKVYFTICAGSANWKTEHFKLIPKLIEEMNLIGKTLRVIVIGDIKQYYKEVDEALLDHFRSSSEILFIDKYVPINETELENKIDFMWRVYKDYSTPATVYKAAELKLPLLTMDYGSLGDFVKHYNMGAVVHPDFSNLNKCINSLDEWEQTNGRLFLNNHSWDFSVKKIIQEISFK